ncbi:MAG: efflux RND transporter periplasmic adaptor subunit [Alphaproteobacteria bacterium]|nr:efflux RND transporter periplasmic adaptor subunit [Alphaproteobacteria bacterium]
MDVMDKPAAPQAPSRDGPRPAQRSVAPKARPGAWIALLGLGAAVAIGGFLVLNQQEEARRPGAAVVTQTPASPGEFRLNDNEMRALRIEPVASRSFRAERVAEGRISVNEDRSTPILAPFTGRVTRTLAQLGDRVEAGAPLFEVETPDVTQAASELLTALDNVGKATTTLAQAERENARQQSLFAARAASQRDVEQARAALATAQSDQRIADASLAAARDRLRVLGRDANAIAEIERSRQVSGAVMVRAPFAGTVTQRRASPGMWLTAGTGEPTYTISDLSTMWLVAAVREVDVPHIRAGQTVDVQVGALPGRSFEARIIRTGAGLDPATRRMTVFAELADPSGALRPEMFATFRIAVSEARNAPAVPASAVIFRGAEANIWVAMDGNRFAMRLVTLGNRAEEMLEVTQGLYAGERIVTGGALFIDRAARID